MREKGRELVQLMADGIASGVPAAVATYDPTVGTALAFAGPAVSLLARWGLNRVGTVASEESGLTAEEIVSRLQRSEGSLRLLAATLDSARTAATEEKLLVLGRCLAQGAMSDGEAGIDEQLQLVAAITALERHHMRLLRVLADPPPEGQEWGSRNIELVDPVLTPERVATLTGPMIAQGVIAPAEDTYGVAYRITSMGRLLIAQAAARVE